MQGIFDDLDEMIRSDFVAPPAPVARCDKCAGSGRFRSWAGRDVGPCHACKGSGTREYRKPRDYAAEARKAPKAPKASKADQWRTANPDRAQWIAAKADRFAFAASMGEALERWGALTPNQLATVDRLMAADVERAAQRSQDTAQRAAKAQPVSVAPIAEAFDRALADGLQRPKLRLAGFTFSLAPSHGRNAGAIYVKTASGDYLGKVAEGRLFTARECTPEAEAEVLKVCANPEAEAVAYGRRMGRCAICARELTDPESVARGIGPICAGRFGW